MNTFLENSMKKLKILSGGGGMCLRTHSVENEDGMICGGTLRQFVPFDDMPLTFLTQASFSKVEALRFIDDVNYYVCDDTTPEEFDDIVNRASYREMTR